MLDSKSCFTSIATKPLLVKNRGPLIVNSEDYRKFMGALQYITITRPDITYSVNKLCQFMNSHSQDHW